MAMLADQAVADLLTAASLLRREAVPWEYAVLCRRLSATRRVGFGLWRRRTGASGRR